jgi:hypothetical protein
MSDDPAGNVLWMIRGAWVTMAMRGAAELGVFDALAEPLTTGQLAERTGAHAPTLARLLRLMEDLGLLERVGGDAYRTTAAGDMLRDGHPSRLRDLVLMQATMANLGAWGALDDAVRTGAGVFEQVNGSSFWEYLGSDPAVQSRFNASMARRASGQVKAVLAATDLSAASNLVDVGGGRGAMLTGLLEAVPTLRGIVADQPAVAAEADAFFSARGLDDRAKGEACDFFVSVPGGADVYTISNVLHDWDDEEATAILATLRAAMPAEATLLVVEHVLDAPGRSFEELRDVHLTDLHMLLLFGARERTQAEYDVLLVAAGFTPSRLADPVTEWNVLEARPAERPE